MFLGARLDASPMRVADLGETATDPLIRSIRKLLRRRNISDGVLCIASDELPQKNLLPLEDNVENPAELSVLPNFRVRIMPVYSPLPCAFGAVLAQQVLNWASFKDQEVEKPLPVQLSNKKMAQLKHAVQTSDVKKQARLFEIVLTILIFFRFKSD